MPQPEGNQLNPSGYVPFLTTIAGGYLPTFAEFIAPQVAPTVPVAAASGTYNVWSRADFMRRGGKRLANHEAPPLDGFNVTSAQYSVDNWGIATMWTERDVAEARAGGTMDVDFINGKVRFVTWKGALEKEIQVATLAQTTGNWGKTYAGVASGANPLTQFNQWDTVGSDPVDDIVRWVEYMRLSAGLRPNTMIVPIRIMNALKLNQNLLDRVKYGGTMDRPTEVTFQQIKALFGIDKLLIPEGVYNTAAEGQAQNLAYIWSDTMWLGYVADAPSRENPSAMYNFAWTGSTAQGLPAGMNAGPGPQAWDATQDREVAGLFMRRFKENRPHGEYLESELWITPNVTGAEFGMTFTAPIS